MNFWMSASGSYKRIGRFALSRAFYRNIIAVDMFDVVSAVVIAVCTELVS